MPASQSDWRFKNRKNSSTAMIDSNDLRIDNLVNYVMRDTTGKVVDATPMRVTAIFENSFEARFLDDSGGRDSKDGPDDFEGIKLAEEWMKKLEFLFYAEGIYNLDIGENF